MGLAIEMLEALTEGWDNIMWVASAIAGLVVLSLLLSMISSPPSAGR
jgi:urea transporter